MKPSMDSFPQMRITFLIASLLVLSQADDDIFSLEKKDNRRHYCGVDLRRVLMLLCDSVYKRGSSDNTNLQEDWAMNFIGMDEPQTVFPFRSRAKALAVLPEYFRRHTRGVADECCSKACTINELNTYCGPKPS